MRAGGGCPWPDTALEQSCRRTRARAPTPIWATRFGSSEAIEAGHERVLERGGDGDAREGAGQDPAVRLLPQEARFEKRPGQLLDEEGDAVGLGDDVPHDLIGEGLAPARSVIMPSTWGRSRGLSVSGVMCERIGQGGWKSGR